MHGAAEYVHSSVPAIAEDYARVCVHGVRVTGKRREIADDSAAHVWCVYGGRHDETMPVECFGEFASKCDAWTYALDLALMFQCPIWDCQRAELSC